MAEGWARLALGFHLLYYATAAEAAVELRRAQACFDGVGDRPGYLLAGAGLARARWRHGPGRPAVPRRLSTWPPAGRSRLCATKA